MKPARIKIRVVALSLLGLAGTLCAQSLDSARAAVEQGRADEAINLTAHVNTADAHNLLCRVYYQKQQWDAAVRECEAAVRAQGASINHLWLGRAYGAKAEHAGMFTAFSLAKQVRQEFEAATKTDPRNAEAFADLGEFYSSAPGIVGGGRDKAESVVKALEQMDHTRAHVLSAQIAREQKDYSRAENELKAAVQSSRTPADAWMTLAGFYRAQQRWDEMMTAVHSGIRSDVGHSSSLVYGAHILMRANREPKLALSLLESYLSSIKKSEDAPSFQVYVDVARLKAQLNDRAGAIEAINKALALAHDFQPALDEKKKLGGPQ